MFKERSTDLSGKAILVTGGTGSFGRKFTKVALEKCDPKVVRIFSRDELKQQEMREEFNEWKRLRFLIGDVRDRERLHRAMNEIDVVIHAAALKQVPTCEYNPIEAIKTNIDGAINVIDAAIDRKVEKVMALSTDKAVHPINLYGATKLVAEKLFMQANFYVGWGHTRFSCVRYGNVVASRGSIIPRFLAQKEKGTITITDEEMTRFWITQEQAVKFVIDCIERMKGAEIFIPKIPSMKIVDLADVIAPDTRHEIIGIRPGEKIGEVLLVEEEARHSREFRNYFVIEPELRFWKKPRLRGGHRLPGNFRYSSENNRQWLEKRDLQAILAKLE